MNNLFYKIWYDLIIKLILPALCLGWLSGCIDKMNLPSDIISDSQFLAGDTTYLLINPIWGTEMGLESPTEISISQDGLIFIADSLAQTVHVFNQSGEAQNGFNALQSIEIIDKDGLLKPVHPIDVDVDNRMNVFFIDGSNRIYCWNQFWSLNGIDEYASGATFLTEAGEDTFVFSQTETWSTAINDMEWELTDVTWSDSNLIIDSLLSTNVIFDGESADTTGDIWYPSTLSSFSGITTLSDESMKIYVTDYSNNRILALGLKRSLLIKLSSGEVIWTHDLVYDHTVSEYGTGAGTVNKPDGIDTDKNGNVYYSQAGDFFNIHKIQPILSGTYPVYPSVFQPGWNDIMDLYRFDSPRDVAVDNNQFVYVANTAEREIQVFDNLGQFFKKAGVEVVTLDTSVWIINGTDSSLVDSIMIEEHKEYLESPSALAVDSKGVIYVCDPLSCSIVRFRLSNQLDENLNPVE